MNDRAHARHSDPVTSHLAADAVTPGLPELQRRVEAFALRIGDGGFTDAEMSAALEDETSTLRTRRAELTARNIILDTGKTRTWGDSPRLRVVWVHRSFIHGPPAVLAPPAPDLGPEREQLQGDALAHAARQRTLAAGLRKQGLGAAADVVEQGAELLARLAR